MSQRLRNNAPYLHVLAGGTPVQRKGVLRGAKKDLIETVCECALNILQGNISLSKTEKQKLNCHKHTLRSLCNRKVGLNKKKKKLLNQKGGFLPALIAPIVASLVGDFAIRGIRRGIQRRRQRRTKK